MRSYNPEVSTESAAASKRVAILQSNYIPWKGYFDLINSVDEFVLYDDMQYTKRDWRNRNKIKTPSGPQWLSIPVLVKGKYLQTIRETTVSDAGWAEKHWRAIELNYARAEFFADHRDFLKTLYERAAIEQQLSQINYLFITEFCKWLGVETRISWSHDFTLLEGKTERLMGICQQAKAGVYLSGPAAQDYLDETAFTAQGIAVEYMNYNDYPEYKQLHPPFDHFVSLIDLLLNTGPEVKSFMKSF